MIGQHMARTIANVAIFLEFSSDDTVDDDAAVQVMEQLAGDLKALDPVARKQLADAFEAVADSYSAEVRAFVRTLPEAFGLLED